MRLLAEAVAALVRGSSNRCSVHLYLMTVGLNLEAFIEISSLLAEFQCIKYKVMATKTGK